MSDKRTGGIDLGPAWKRWHMAAFDVPAAPESPPQPSVPTAAELHTQIESLRNAALTRGHAEGYAAGHAQGLAAGTEEGRRQGVEEGRKQGHEAGLQAGHAKGQETARLEARRLESLALACAEAVASVENEMGQAMISLAVSIAEQVLRSTLDEHPEKILELVRDIAHIDTSKETVLRLRLNPADQELVQRYLDKEPGTGHWQILPDESVERGGCLAESALGNINATLQTRWQRVISSLGQDPQRFARDIPDVPIN